MESFGEFLNEHSIHYFDVDETLFHHPRDESGVRVHVRDAEGKHVRSLTNTEYNTHKLEPGHAYDYSEFKSSKRFGETAKPIRKTIAKLKAIKKNGGHTELLTARQDMDDKETFAKHFHKYGIDINKVHVRRAGNTPGPPAEAKGKIVSGAIEKHGYKNVHLYDDNKQNLDHFLSLKNKHPGTTFHAHHVDFDHDSHKVSITTRKV